MRHKTQQLIGRHGVLSHRQTAQTEHNPSETNFSEEIPTHSYPLYADHIRAQYKRFFFYPFSKGQKLDGSNYV
jgi:hypothetical protein